jgi:hypothetical protein
MKCLHTLQLLRALKTKDSKVEIPSPNYYRLRPLLQQPTYLGTMSVAAVGYALVGRLDAPRKAVARPTEIHVSTKSAVQKYSTD